VYSSGALVEVEVEGCAVEREMKARLLVWMSLRKNEV
jgi:hypothetical protein